MTRLTNELRDKIVRAAKDKAGITAAFEALDAKRYAWAERLRVEAVGGAESAERYAAINAHAKSVFNALPSNLRGYSYVVQRAKEFYANLGGKAVRVQLEQYAEVRSDRMALAGDHSLCREFAELEAEKESIENRAAEIDAQVRAVLNRFNTVAQLLAAWPEAQSLLPPKKPEPERKAVALPVADLNKLVGLSK